MTKLIKIGCWTEGVRVNVVFVHGLGGSAYGTWRRGEGEEGFWPVWLVRDIPGLTAWTLDYDAPMTNWIGTAMPIQDRAKNVLECVFGRRELRDAPIVFVCHSLGGLVVKQALRAADGRRAHSAEAQALLDAVKGVVFIATPHTGSMQATLLNKLRLIAWPSASTLDLVRNNANLRDVNVWYRSWSGPIRHKVFYEKQGTSVGLIVGDDSSDPGLLHVDPIGIDADHLSICKPADASDLVYARTRDFVVDEITPRAGSSVGYGTCQVCDLPNIRHARSKNFAPIALRLVIILIAGLIAFKGVQSLFFPTDVLGTATIEQIEIAIRAKSPKLTPTQINQFIGSLRELSGDPSFVRAVEEATRGNTRVAEGIWLQIYENRKKDVQRAQKEQAEAARNLAASAVVNNVAQALKWYREATSLDPDNMAGWLGLGDAAVAAGLLDEADLGFLKYISLAKVAKDERAVSVGWSRHGDVQVWQGKVADAKTSYQTSFSIADRLSKSDFQNAAWLSRCHRSIGDIHAMQGNSSAALIAYQAALAIVEQLTKSYPENTSWQRDLAVLHDRIGSVQFAQGKLSDALSSHQADRVIMERLVKSQPNNTGWQDDLAQAHLTLGDVEREQGDLNAALSSYRAAYEIEEHLAKSDPSNADWQRQLGFFAGAVGDVEYEQGKLRAALASHQTSFAIADSLAKRDPGNADWQRDLTASLLKFGEVQEALGQRSAALSSYSTALTTAEDLLKIDSSSPDWLSLLREAKTSVGYVRIAEGDFPAALTLYQAAFVVADQLAKSDPANAVWQQTLIQCYRDVGEAQKAQGDFASALTSFKSSLRIANELVKGDPDNLKRQRDLSISHSGIGDVQLEQKDIPAALTSFRAALAIAEHLAKADPKNSNWQSDLSLVRARIGDAQVVASDFPNAIISYESGVAIAGQLAKSNPDNVVLQRNLSVSYRGLAEAYASAGHPSKALEALSVGSDIMKRLAEEFPEGPVWKQEVIKFDQRIAELKG